MIDRAELAAFGWYRGQLGWLPTRTIFLGLSGSQSYGTATPESDLDLKGVAIAPRAYYLGFLHRFEQAETKGPPVDATVYDLRKYVELAADCNPNIVEQLYLRDEDVVVTTPTWERIRAARGWFLSRKARHTFSGYAFAQLKRIRTHRAYLLQPPKGKPTRAAFGLPDAPTLGKEQLGVVNAEVRKGADTLAGSGWTRDRVEAEAEPQLVEGAIRRVNLDVNLIPIVLAERRYAAAARQWDAYQGWKATRNPKRAALEAKYQYDCKHAMHLVRLLRMGNEILRFGEVRVYRPDADELRAIRDGAWTFDQVEAYAQEMETKLVETEKTSPLPHGPDREAIDGMVVDILAGACLDGR